MKFFLDLIEIASMSTCTVIYIFCGTITQGVIIS